MKLCSEKLSRLEKIYSQTRQFFNEHSSHYLTKPNSLGGKTGFCILYTPPILNADMMVVGQNPSVFNVDNDCSSVDKLMMSGNIPTVNSYLEHNHLFGDELKKIFEYDPQTSNVLDNCVGMNIWFFQATTFKRDRQLNKIIEFCEKQTRIMISLLRPKTIFACGMEAFRVCDKDGVNRSEKDDKGHRYYAEGSFGRAIPVFGCPHITGKVRYKAADREKGIRKCKENILLHVGQ